MICFAILTYRTRMLQSLSKTGQVVLTKLEYAFFYKKKVYKKMRLKSSKYEENRKKITKLNLQQ